MSSWIENHQKASSLHQQGQLILAEQYYQQALDLAPGQDQVWSKLAQLYIQTERYIEAQRLVLKALEIAPRTGLYHYYLGLIFEKLNDINQTIQAQRNAITLDPKLLDSYMTLGRLLTQVNDLAQATGVYQQAIAQHPHSANAHHALGQILLTQSQFAEAIATLETAHQLNSSDPKILATLSEAYQAEATAYQLQAAFYLGLAYYCQDQFKEAAEQYEKFLSLSNALVDSNSIQRVYRCLGDCYQKLGQLKLAIQTYRAAIEHCPEVKDFYQSLISLLRQTGQTQAVIQVAAIASEKFPDTILFQRDRWLTLPVLYQFPDEVLKYRQHFEAGLKNLAGSICLNTPEAQQQALKALGYQTNFYLHYQGQNDRELQYQYGQLLHQTLQSLLPQWVQLRTMPPVLENGKIRIGYISTCMWKQTVGLLFLGWLQHCDRQNFEVYSYHLHPQSDEITQKFQQASDRLYHLPAPSSIELDYLHKVSERITQDQLHILVFLDVGMHPYMSLLSSLRLAPIQCVTWGHPVTTGSPTMDYFLSSELMEPPGAEAHYSEKLIKLPGIGIAYAQPELSEAIKTRTDFQLREDAILYLSCQTLFKYLPQHDYILAAIAQQVPQAQFAFISHKNPAITEQFSQRLQRAFANYGLNSQDYCVLLPRLGHRDYLSLNCIADVFLDTFSWSGGNTALEAIACGLPIVTCPGTMMRSRHSYAVLKMMEITETVASNEADYIEIAVRLGLDSKWRNQLKEKIVTNRSYVYQSVACIKTLEDFYSAIAKQEASPHFN